jgi:hypothetical protein
MSLAFESIAPGNRFEFDPDSVLDGNHGSCLEFKSRPGRAELVNGQWIVAVHQHVPTPLTDSHNEQFDLEIGGRLPLGETFQYPCLGIFVLRRRSFRCRELAGRTCRRPPQVTNDVVVQFGAQAGKDTERLPRQEYAGHLTNA